MTECPKYLQEYKKIWDTNKKDAVLAWFKNANYGLFLHYGLYSLLHKPAWCMSQEKIPLAQYETLIENFTAHNFNAEYITDMAIRAGMKYITLTSCHHEGFCLWDSKNEPFNSMNSPAKRDLIKELSEACDRKGLGFFAYYTFMLNWRHPYILENTVFPISRPNYDFTEPRYRYTTKDDFKHYIDYAEKQIDELLCNYTITGIWLDIIVAWYYLGEDYIPIQNIYKNIRKKHPQVLISWKQGATGTEDFASPEQSFHDMSESIRREHGEAAGKRAKMGFDGNKDKHNEICATVQDGAWAYNPFSKNRSAQELYNLLGHAQAHNCNLLLNLGPMADGSINPVQEKVIIDIADMIKIKGFPTSANDTISHVQTSTKAV